MTIKRQGDLHKGHRQRLTETFLKGGKLTDIQFLEMLLFYCIPRIDTNEISHRLLDKFGSVRNVLDAKADEIERVRGMGKTSTEKLSQIGKVLSAYIDETRKTNRIDREYLTYVEAFILRKVCPTLLSKDSVFKVALLSFKKTRLSSSLMFDTVPDLSEMIEFRERHGGITVIVYRIQNNASSKRLDSNMEKEKHLLSGFDFTTFAYNDGKVKTVRIQKP